MTQLFSPLFVIELALILIVIEIALLLLWNWRARRGLSVLGLLANASAGGFILLACQSVLRDATPVLVAVLLGAALIAHLVDLVMRWRTESSQ